VKKIYSRVNESLLLHLILDDLDFSDRLEIIQEDNFLQLATMSLLKGQEFAAHRHLDKDVNFSKFHAQESWVVMSGAVAVTFFDIDDTEIETHIVEAGGVSITLRGGHSYKVIENSRVLEFKTGPYLGRDADKMFLTKQKKQNVN
jgi:hypothetical protein